MYELCCLNNKHVFIVHFYLKILGGGGGWGGVGDGES